MLRTEIELPDHTFLWLRASRRKISRQRGEFRGDTASDE